MMKCFTSAYKLVVEKNRWNITEQDDKNYTEDHTQVSGNAKWCVMVNNQLSVGERP